MAVRTTSGAVQLVLGGNYDTTGSPSLTPYMDAATSVVDDVVVCATERGVTLSATKLELIERWLSAHFYTQMDPLYLARSTERASGSFQPHSYLAVAISLDSSGCVKDHIEGFSHVEITWLGKPPSTQISYRDRD